jgi:hypothetical protein
MLNYPNIGDIVHLQRFNEPEIFGIVIGYEMVISTGGTLVKIEWFDGLTSSEYPIMLKVQNG